jgi:hypothetical protein
MTDPRKIHKTIFCLSEEMESSELYILNQIYSWQVFLTTQHNTSLPAYPKRT